MASYIRKSDQNFAPKINSITSIVCCTLMASVFLLFLGCNYKKTNHVIWDYLDSLLQNQLMYNSGINHYNGNPIMVSDVKLTKYYTD